MRWPTITKLPTVLWISNNMCNVTGSCHLLFDAAGWQRRATNTPPALLNCHSRLHHHPLSASPPTIARTWRQFHQLASSRECCHVHHRFSHGVRSNSVELPKERDFKSEHVRAAWRLTPSLRSAIQWNFIIRQSAMCLFMYLAYRIRYTALRPIWNTVPVFRTCWYSLSCRRIT